MDRHTAAAILNEIGTMLELKGENFFKARAYYDAARTIELLEENLETLVSEGRLKDIKGIGTALTQKLTELITTNHLEYYESLKASIPEGLMEMLKIQGLGIKKVAAIYENLGISSIGELKYACLENRLAMLPGFGVKSQNKVLEGIENLGRYSGKHLFPEAWDMAEKLADDLLASGKAARVSIAGSLRRRKEIVKDIDLLAGSDDAEGVMDAFTSNPLVEQIISRGGTKASVILINGINADLRVVEDDLFAYALHHFTGSREHNTAFRHLAKQAGIKMNEYGLFRVAENEDVNQENDGVDGPGDIESGIKCTTEEEIFRAFGMQYIPPELRENNGELEAAKLNNLPELVEPDDIKGVIHMHSNFSDGTNSVEELVKACIAKGYAYLGLTDHSKTAFYAGGMKPEDIYRQHEEIETIRCKYPGFTILKGIELEILPDGSVDYADNDDEILSLFDFTIASVHSSFNMDEERMTERVVRAMKNRYVSILGHPTGRLLLSREPFRINMDEIIRTAAMEKVVLEINASPHRLDLDWRNCRAAKDKGCKFVISPDAHRTEGIDDIKYGVNVARKGWLTADDIINVQPAEGFMSCFKQY